MHAGHGLVGWSCPGRRVIATVDRELGTSLAHPSRLLAVGLATLMPGWLLLVLLLSAWLGQAAEMPSDDYFLEFYRPAPRNGSWFDLHNRYVEEIRSKAQGLDLLVYGDSVTEAFRGSSFGRKRKSRSANREAWDSLVGPHYQTGIYSISGDRAGNLLWRLKNGEGPSELQAVRAVAVLIGTNDIGRMYRLFQPVEAAARGVFVGVRAVLEEVAAQAPTAKLLVLSLPPLQPNSELKWQPQVDLVNALLKEYADLHADQMVFADCAEPLLSLNSTSATTTRLVDYALMPDGMHPEGLGGWVFAECVEEALEELLG